MAAPASFRYSSSMASADGHSVDAGGKTRQGADSRRAVKRFIPLIALIAVIFGVWAIIAYRSPTPTEPVESAREAAPPVEEDYQRELIASMKEKGQPWTVPVDGEIPDLALIRSFEENAETVSLRALIRESSQPAALV